MKLLKFLGIFSILFIASLLIFQYNTDTGYVTFKMFNIFSNTKTSSINVDDFVDNIVKKSFTNVCGKDGLCLNGRISYEKLNRYIIVQGDPCKTELIGSTNCKLAPFKDVAGKSGFYIFSIKGSKLSYLVGPETQMWQQIKPGIQTTTYTTTGHVASDQEKKKCANNEDKTPNVAKNKGAILLKPTGKDMAIAVINTRGTGKYSEEDDLEDMEGAARDMEDAARDTQGPKADPPKSDPPKADPPKDSKKLCDNNCPSSPSTGPIKNFVNKKPKLIDITVVSQPGLDGDRKGPLIIPNLRKDGATDNREPGNSNLIGGPCSKGMLPTLGETFTRQVTIKIISDTDPFLRDIPVSS